MIPGDKILCFSRIDSHLMSKKQDEYRHGLERLFQYLEIFLRERTIPTCEEIEAEWRATDGLRPIPHSIHLSSDIQVAEDGFIFLLGEEYERYDDRLPTAIRLYLLPAHQDVPKEINRFLTLQPIE